MIIQGGLITGAGGGGLSQWDPIAHPALIQAGIKNGSGTFLIVNNPTTAAIDDVPTNTSVNTIIFFNESSSRWEIASANSSQQKYKGTFDTAINLEAESPAINQAISDTAFVRFQNDGTTPLNTTWYVSDATGVNLWTNTGLVADPGSAKIVANLSDLENKATARANLNVYSKSEVDSTFNKIKHYEFALLAPQSIFNIAHNRNAFITSIKYSTFGNNNYNGVVGNYTEVDNNNVSFTLDAPLPLNTTIKIQFNL